MGRLTIADAPPRHDNHFNLIRFLAASAVIYSHGYNAVLGPESKDPLKALTGISFGEIAVNLFFALSGFLVAASLVNRGTLRAFVAARALRIYPALILSVSVTALIIGPIFTTLGTGEYFSAKMTWGYLVRNCLSLNPLWFRWELPGVFNDLPSADITNSPLWTLPWEIGMYISLALMFAVRLFRPVSAVAIWLLASALYAAGNHLLEFPPLVDSGLRFTSFFYGGVALYFLRARCPRSKPLLVLACVLIFLAIGFNVGREAMTVLLPYVTVSLGYANAPALLSFNRVGDASYGLYIYAFPLQQILVAGMGTMSPWMNSLLTFLIIFPLALASWHLMEKPILGLKSRFH